MERNILLLSGLTPEESAALALQGIVSGDDLSIITHEDLKEILPEATVVKRRKLCAIGDFLAQGQAILDGTSMPDIVRYLNTPAAAIVAAQPAPPRQDIPIPPGLPPRPPPDPDRGALKLYVNSIEKFSGFPIDYEDWAKKTRALLG